MPACRRRCRQSSRMARPPMAAAAAAARAARDGQPGSTRGPSGEPARRLHHPSSTELTSGSRGPPTPSPAATITHGCATVTAPTALLSPPCYHPYPSLSSSLRYPTHLSQPTCPPTSRLSDFTVLCVPKDTLSPPPSHMPACAHQGLDCDPCTAFSPPAHMALCLSWQPPLYPSHSPPSLWGSAVLTLPPCHVPGGLPPQPPLCLFVPPPPGAAMSRPLVATLTIHTSPCSALDWQRHVIQGPFHLQFKVTAEINSRDSNSPQHPAACAGDWGGRGWGGPALNEEL